MCSNQMINIEACFETQLKVHLKEKVLKERIESMLENELKQQKDRDTNIFIVVEQGTGELKMLT